MRNFIALGLLLIVSHFTTSLYAQDKSHLLYQGKVIDPLCFDRIEIGVLGQKNSDTVDLKTCHLQHAEDRRKKGNLFQKDDGTIGYKFERGRLQYRYLGRISTDDYVLIYSSGGGSGSFSLISKFRVVGSDLKFLDDIAMGDRCIGGLSNVRIEDGHLLYQRNMTPANFGYMALEQKIVTQRPVRGILLSAPIDCVAVADYRDNEIVGADLSKAMDHLPKDDCFVRARDEYISQHGDYIPKTEFSGFFGILARNCGLQ